MTTSLATQKEIARDGNRAEINARHAVNLSQNTLNFTHDQRHRIGKVVTQYELCGANLGFDSGKVSFDIGANSANVELSSIPVELAELLAKTLGDYAAEQATAKSNA